MKQGQSRWTRLGRVGWMALGLALTAQGAKDEFLTLGPPLFTGNKVQFTITGEADAVYVIESSEDGLFWSPRITNYDKTITRFVSLDRSPHAEYYRGWRRRLPVFSAAIAARTSINFSNRSLTVDSFDSTDPNFSTAGRYDPMRAKAGGDVATIDGWVNVDNARIHGQIRTGLKGAFSFGPNGYAGPIGWDGPGLFSSDWYRRDFRFVIPDVPTPYTNGIPPMPAPAGTNSWMLGSGDYYVSGNFSLNNQVLLVTGDARLLVRGNFAMSGSLAELKVCSGASLQLYVAGTNAAITRVTVLDPAANCSSFQYYGLSGNRSFSWSPYDTFTGTIYAPAATVKLGGGGMNVYDFQGACAANDVVLCGHLNFHFDENLTIRGPQR